MAKIYLVRHGQTDWNRERRVLGWSDIPLNAAGAAQVRKLAELVSTFKITAIYSSPLPRALQTAQILGSVLGLNPAVEARLTESNIGSWEGHYWQELEDDPIRQQYYTRPKTARPPNGETLWEVQQRAVAAVTELCNQQPDRSSLVVSHADVIRCLLSHYIVIDLGMSQQLRIDYASVSLISLDAQGAVLGFLNIIADRSRCAG